MNENDMPNQSNSGYSEQSSDYLSKAADACAEGDLVLGMHLYLAAYEKAVADPNIPDGMELSGLREAWNLACDLKERSMAEYVFEKLEPYLTGDEIAACAGKLQNMALDRLEEYGFSREELEDMAEMISQDLATGNGSVVKVESIAIPHAGSLGITAISSGGAIDEPSSAPLSDEGDMAGVEAMFSPPSPTFRNATPTNADSHAPAHDEKRPTEQTPRVATSNASEQSETDAEADGTRADATGIQPNLCLADVNDFNPYDMYRDYSIGKSYHAATNEGSGAAVVTLDEERAEAHEAFERARDHQPAETETAEPELTMDNVLAAARNDALQSQLDHIAQNTQFPRKMQSLDDAAAQTGVHLAAQPNTFETAGDQSPSGDVAKTPYPANGATQQPAASQASQADPANGATQQSAASQSSISKRNGHAPQKASGQTMPSMPNVPDMSNRQPTYDTLKGYNHAIDTMRTIGIGLHDDAEFLGLIATLNEQHGLTRPPALDTLVFRAPAVEDASRFVEATAAEIGLPVLRMAMEEGIQGIPVLVVMTQGNHRPRMNHAQNKFEAPAILVIEQLDTWSMPAPPEGAEGIGNFIMANISRGAREAVGLIRSAVEDPDVFVLATMSSTGEPDPFFFDLLEPLTIVDIDYPDEAERADIWWEIANDHPSMRAIDREALVRLSGGMPRYDMYLAAREAIEEAYKTGLVKRGYVPVTPQNIFEKLAACQPLESPEYQALEDEVVRNFLIDIENLNDLADIED